MRLATKEKSRELELLLVEIAQEQLYSFSQIWFPTVQEVLQADWQDV